MQWYVSYCMLEYLQLAIECESRIFLFLTNSHSIDRVVCMIFGGSTKFPSDHLYNMDVSI